MSKELEKREKRMNKKKKEILILGVVALLLIVAVWQVFFKEPTQEASISILSENERKISRILKEIEGVCEASVMICETEEGVQSVVVVCEGAKNLRVVMDVREAVAAALGTEEKSIKVYSKKE